MATPAKKKPQVQGKPKRSGPLPGRNMPPRRGSGGSGYSRGVTPTYPGGPARGRATPAAVPAKPLSKPVPIGGVPKKNRQMKPKPITPTYPGGPARGRATPAAVPAKPLSKPVPIGGAAKKKKPKPATQIPGFAYGRKTY